MHLNYGWENAFTPTQETSFQIMQKNFVFYYTFELNVFFFYAKQSFCLTLKHSKKRWGPKIILLWNFPSMEISQMIKKQTNSQIPTTKLLFSFKLSVLKQKSPLSVAAHDTNNLPFQIA